MKTQHNYTPSNFNSGNGLMTEETFVTYVNQVGIFDAVQIAKYFGVSLVTVQLWVKSFMKRVWK